ncbi:hypothetical protein V6N13_055071 [Hibiscus sabdariffa]
MVRASVHWIIGNGRNVAFWSDVWIKGVACVPPNPMHPDDKVGWSGESSVDSLDVYRALRDMKSRELRCSLVMHVSNLMARQWEVKVSHVICDGNFVADGLAELVTRNSRSVNVFKEPPPSIIRSLSGDASV